MAASIALPGSQLDTELREDSYDTVPPQGRVGQSSEPSLPPGPVLPPWRGNIIDLSHDDGDVPLLVSDDDGGVPLLASDDEELPPVSSLFQKSPTNIDPQPVNKGKGKKSHFKELIKAPSSNTTHIRGQNITCPTIMVNSSTKAMSQSSVGPKYQTSADPKGYPPTNYNPKKPFRLLDCEDSVRQRIFQHILTSPDPITPYYYEGSAEGTAQQVERENYPIPMLVALAGKANKCFYDEARDILYGWNTWDFTDPEVSLWWLKQIKDNVNSIRHMGIHLSQGEARFNVRIERKWWSLVNWLKPRQKLDTIYVSFEQWDAKPVEGMPPNEYPPVNEPRVGTLRTLLAFRGLQRAEVVGCAFFGTKDALLLEKAMCLSEGQYDIDVEVRDRQLRGPPKQRYNFG